MDQGVYNKASVTISIVALALSIVFPYIKETFLDRPVIYHASSKYVNLSQYFGNPSIGTALTLVNNGKKTTTINKIEIALFSETKQLIIPPKEANILELYSNTSVNVIVLNPTNAVTCNVYFDYNNENIEATEEINNLNIMAIDYLNSRGCKTNNDTSVEINDSMFNIIKDKCVNNMNRLASGNYRLLYLIYQDNKPTPAITFAKSFSITESAKKRIILSIQNYKSGAHLMGTNKLLYPGFVTIRTTEIYNEEKKALEKALPVKE